MWIEISQIHGQDSKKLEIPMEAAMPCEMGTKKRLKKLRETASESDESNKIQKTKLACVVEAHESTRKRLESTLPKDHEDRIAGKGFNSLSHRNFFMESSLDVHCTREESGKGISGSHTVRSWEI